MRRLIILLFLFTLIPVTTAQEQETLLLLDSDPLEGEELQLRTPVTFYFSDAVNCQSEGVVITPEIEGVFSCDEGQQSLTFTPSEDYQHAMTYTFTLTEELQAGNGTQLREPVNLTFSTVGFLGISEVLPAPDTEGVSSSNTITVVFNRPVIPLTTSVNAADLPSPITIEPETAGTGEWLNTAIYVFRPETILAPGTEYKVTVNEGLSSADGAVMTEPYAWKFTTTTPQILRVEPYHDATSILLQPEIRVYFNHPVDRLDVQRNFYLHPQDTPQRSVPGRFEWTDDSMVMMYKPLVRLKMFTVYKAGINVEGMKPASGNQIPLTGNAQWEFTTVNYPLIQSTSPADQQTNVSHGGFSIHFPTPMDEASFEGKITVEPEPEQLVEYYQYTSYYLAYPIEPNTTYTVTIAPGLKDIYGNVLNEGRTITYTTAPPSPYLNLNVPGIIGFYNAYYEDTGVYLIHRNLDKVQMRLYSVPMDDFIGVTQNFNYSAYEPDNALLMRDWTVDLNNTENYTPDYLNLSAASTCAGAMPTRLKVGDMVVPLPENGVGAVANPGDEQITAYLYPGSSLKLIGGPVCNNRNLWWQTENAGWVAEAMMGEYVLEPLTESQVQVTNGALPPGVYYLDMDTTVEPFLQRYHFMMVMTANLIMKSSVDEVLVWATDVHSGKPIPNTPITIYDTEKKIIASGVTDDAGFLKVRVPRITNLYDQPRVAIMQTDDHFGLTTTTMSQGIDPGWFEGVSADFYPRRYQAYVYTDRAVYRPDQEVYFRAVIRNRDDVTYTAPDVESVPVIIRNNNGEIIYEKTLPVSKFGTISDSIKLDAEAQLGYYSILVNLPYPENTQPEGGSAYFHVAEYRLPEFQASLTPEKDEISQNEPLRMLLQSNYYFGSPVSNASVEYSVTNRPYYFRYTGEGHYQFGTFFDEEEDQSYLEEKEVARDTGTTDDQGQFLIEAASALPVEFQSRVFSIAATVIDESNQAISAQGEVIVHAAQIYLGAQPEKYVGRTDQPMNINLIAVDWESVGLPDQTIELEVVRREWFSVQEMGSDGRSTWIWDYEDTPVTDGTVTTGSEGKAQFSFTPTEGGMYYVRLKSRDSLDNEVRGQAAMWVSSQTYVTWRQENNNRIDLIADRQRYEVGDTAEILIASPFQGTAEAIITVERGDVLHHERLTLESNSTIYQLPITADYAPNVYVSVVVIKGVDETNPVAAFRMGTVGVEVDRSVKEITLNIEADGERVMPGETVQYTLKATNSEGTPVEAEVGVAVTDLAALSVMDNQTPPLIDFFYRLQGLGIRTTTPLTMNTDQLTQGTLDMVKGGGGGGGGMGIIDLREEFEDTPYWNPSLVTNPDGEATFEVTLPDNLTTWRLDARAVTSGEDGLTLVGQTTHDIVSTLPLIVRPVTPRFFIVDDQLTLAAVINNNTDEDLTLTVSLDAEGVSLVSPAEQLVTVTANSRLRVEWESSVQNVENVELIFSAIDATGRYSDAARPAVGLGDDRLLPVYRYEAPETVGTAGMLNSEGTRTESIALPRRFNVTEGNLTVKMQPSLAATTIDSLDYLEAFPHACIEQTVSAFLPNIITYRALEELDLTDPTLRAQLQRNVNNGLQRLLTLQKTDGGWGWFVNDASNPLTTSYALIALVEARRQGFTVPQDVIDRAYNFLSNNFVVPSLAVDTWRLNRQAFVLYTLARTGRPDVARTSTLYEHRERLNQDAQIYLLLTLHIIDPESTRVETLVSNMMSRAVVSASGTYWDESVYDFWNWTTDTRTTALALKALVTVQPESELIPNVVRWLITQRNTQAWETTQETAWAVMALTDWMVVSGELEPDYSYSALLNGTTLESGSAGDLNIRDTRELKIAVSDLLQAEMNQLVFSHSEGEGVLYYTAHLTAYLPVPEIQPLNKGIILNRWYSNPDDEEKTPITEAKVGDLIQVNLTIVAPNALHYVVIDDPIPAGAEIINSTLNNQPNVRPSFSRISEDYWHGWGWWWFTETQYRDEKVNLYSEYLAAGTYEYVYYIRAGLEGTYNVIPPTGQEFYFPEVYGRGAGSTFTITGGE